MKHLIFTFLGSLIICCGVLLGAEIVFGNEGTQKWAFKTGGGVLSSTAFGADGTIYVGSNDGHLYAIEPQGLLKWKFRTEGAVHSRPAIGNDGTIYAGSFDHNLYAVRPDGSLKWKFPTRGRVSSSPALGPDGTIYISSWDSYIYAIRPDGSQKWKLPTRGEIISSPVLGPDGSIYVGSWDHHLYAIKDGVSGATALNKTLSKENRIGTMVMEIQEIRVNTTSSEREEVIFVLNGNFRPHVFSIEGDRPRLVCDFFFASPGKGLRHHIDVNSEYLRQIRTAFHTDPEKKVRIVLDFEPGKGFTTDQRFIAQEKHYVIEVKPANSD